ncbi:MAG: carboxy terminal-processing peptidase [Kiritimatiellia bacterium]|jgi:carboxyl-terminal processing protease
MMKHFAVIRNGALAVSFFILSLTQACAWEPIPSEEDPAEEAGLHPEIVRLFAQKLPRAHLSRAALDDALSAVAWTNFLTSLDYERIYFMESDIARFEASRELIDDMLCEGDLSFAHEVMDVYRERVADREAFVARTLEAGFDLTADEEYTWKRKDAPWPATPEERDDLWRRRITNEYLVRLLADEAQTNETARAETPPAESPEADPAPETGPAPEADPDPEAPAPMKKPTPEEFIAKRYRNLAIFVADHDEDWLVERFLCSVAAAFDPHSGYMAPTSVDDFNIDMNLSLCGIGATLSSEEGTAKVVDIIPGGPADRDERDIRLRVGDRIIGVGQGDEPIEDILHLPLPKAVRKIRGEKGTKVVLSVINDTDPNGRLIDLVRDEIKLEEQAATGRVERVTLFGDADRLLGVVRLPAFYGSVNTRPGTPGFRSCAYDVARILADMNNEGVEGLLLDLRGNGGGSLREAILLAGLFIRYGPVVQVREIRGVQQLIDRDPAVAFRKPMVVLVDRLSASASEIVAGALQDYGRAVIVGDASTHGKGTVQTVLPVGRSEAYGSMKVTTATFYRVSGASTQQRGIVPDIVLPSPFDYMELGEANLPNAMPWTTVFNAEYQKVADLSAYIPELAAASEERRASSESFQRYLGVVDLARQAQERTTFPLQLEKRRALVEEERALREAAGGDPALDAADDPDAADAGQDDPREDAVLEEGLAILSHLVDLQGMEDLFPPVDDRQQRMLELMRRIFE